MEKQSQNQVKQIWDMFRVRQINKKTMKRCTSDNEAINVWQDRAQKNIVRSNMKKKYFLIIYVIYSQPAFIHSEKNRQLHT